MRSTLRLALAATVTVALAAACTGAPATPNEPAPPSSSGGSAGGELKGDIDFQTWSLKNDRFTPYFEQLVADFEKENPGTKINWMDQPGEGYEEKLLQQANSNSLPDVVNLSEGMAYNLAKADQLLDLKAADAATLDTYVEGAVQAYQYEDVEGSYGYPWYLGTDLNFWNTKLLGDVGVTEADLPTTLDGIFELGEKVAKDSGGKVFMISEMPTIGAFSNAGVELYKDGKFVFNSPEGVALLDKYVAAYKAGAMPPESLTGDYLGNSTLYKQGKVAWTTGSAGFASELANDAPSILETSVTTARVGTPPLFVQGISVSKNSDNPELALAFAQYVTNNTNQVKFLELAQGFFPGTKEANENPESFTAVIENPKQKIAAEQAAEVIGDAKVDKPVQWTDAMGTYLAQQLALAIRGDISSQEALDKAVQNANDTL